MQTHLGVAEGNDFHRRDADAEKQDELIAGNRQRAANRAEWLRLAQVAADAGDFVVAGNRVKQAERLDFYQ